MTEEQEREEVVRVLGCTHPYGPRGRDGQGCVLCISDDLRERLAPLLEIQEKKLLDEQRSAALWKQIDEIVARV